MKKIALIYGSLSGAIIIGIFILTASLNKGDMSKMSEVMGYLIMAVAMTLIFVGIKKYRDQEQGGVIKFGKAFLVGFAISVVASIIYVAVWEVYLALTDHSFADQYVSAMVAKWEAKGFSDAELMTKKAELEAMMANYQNPLFRIPITFTEILPLALLISLVSAALLQNSKFLPARG